MNFDIDIAIVIAFLVVSLAIGLYKGSGVISIKDYALGGRNFSTATLTAAIVATWIGGDNFALSLSETYTQGIRFILASFAALGCFLITAHIYLPRMQEFLGDLSVAESMGKLYGSTARVITASAGIILLITLVSVQFKIASTVLGHLIGSSGSITTIGSAVVVILYSSFGGIRSVTYTDVIQFFTFGTIIPFIAWVVWSGISDTSIVLNTLNSNPLFDFGQLLDYKDPNFWGFLTLMTVYLMPDFEPTIFQRISMAQNIAQIRRALTYAAIAGTMIQLMISWISILILSRDSSLDANNLFAYILENYSFIGLKALFVIGVLTIVMSSADSELNTGSVMFSHDIASNLNFIKKDNELIVSRITTIVVGVAALLLALKFENLLELLMLGYSFYMPIVTIPLTLAVFGFRTTAGTGLAGMSAGFFVALGWIFLDTGVESLIPGLIANLVGMLSYHYLTGQPGGWVKKQWPGTTHGIKVKLSSTAKRIGNFNFIKFCKNNTPRNESGYVLFALFSIVSIFSTSYTIPKNITNDYQSLMSFVYFSTLVFSIFFLTLPILSEDFRRSNIVPVTWIAALFYILAFTPGLLVVMSNFSQYPFMMFILSAVLMSILTKWQTAICLLVSGVTSSIYFFKLYTDADHLTENFVSVELNIMYVILLIISVLIAFLKPKQEYIEATEYKVDNLEVEVGELEHENVHLGQEVNSLNEKVTDLDEKVGHYSQRVADQAMEIERLGATAQKILNNVNHELRLPVGNVMNFAGMLSEGLEQYNKEQLKEISDEVFKNSNRLSTMILNMLDLAMLDVKKIELNKKTVNLGELVEDRVNNCRKVYLQGKDIDFELKIEPNILASVDPNYIRQTVDNLVINAITYSQNGTIKVSVLKKGKNRVEFTIEDEGIGIPKSELFDIFNPFKMGIHTQSKAEGRGVGLALCKSAVEAHGGVIEVASEEMKGAIFKVTLPV
jgi:Na+/proline symporter/signal transduction histidine kinase